MVAALLCALALSVVAACGSSSSTGLRGASEVQAQPVNTAGNNPFTASVGQDHQGIQPPAAAASTSGGPAQYKADLPGLYGGTRNKSSCDATKLVSYLQQNPSKAAAWASTLGIRTDQIKDYVSKLTNVLLRTDTRVTNHGYVNGQANGFQAVLEAGTAVFVDPYGRPVVKCYCGNPLTAPQLLSSPTYTGPTWSGFNTTNITIVQQSITIINTYTLYDPNTGQLFPRTAGQGGTDGPYQGSGTGSPGTQNPSGPASISLSPNPVTAGGTVTLSASGFAPNSTLTINVHRPDGGSDSPRTTTTDSQGSASYTFPNAGGSLTGNYSVSASDSAGHSASAAITVVPAGGGGGGGQPSTPGPSPPTPGTPTQ